MKGSATDVQIYLNPGLINLIKNSFFNTPMAFGYKYRDYYMLSHLNPDHNEPELTISIIALGTQPQERFSFYLWVITDEYCSSSMLCYGNGLKERRWNQVLRAKERNLKVKNLKGFMIDMWRLWRCWRRSSIHTIISCWDSIQKSHKSLPFTSVVNIVFKHFYMQGWG